MVLKHIHMLLALLSVSLFILRFILQLKGSGILQKKWIKVTPHVIDTFLLTAGVVLIVQYQLYPTNVMWMAEKLVAVLAYIVCGFYTLKLARTNFLRWFGFIGAMGWVLLVVRIATSKSNFLF
ncbi:SirB2 family protein [Thalassotalea aquiviva]|uniref:SirB2 family protein n=1 Tax=Thalassotalea aquiviva TaxID=3242415 RepID=UPI00352B1921